MLAKPIRTREGSDAQISEYSEKTPGRVRTPTLPGRDRQTRLAITRSPIPKPNASPVTESDREAGAFSAVRTPKLPI